MLVATFRHADNAKGPGLINPGITQLGVSQAKRTSKKAVPFFKDMRDVMVVSSPLRRAGQTASILGQEFKTHGIQTTHAACPELDAKTAKDHMAVIQSLWNIPEMCIRNAIPIPQAVVLITHAHNMVGHLVGKMIDPEFGGVFENDAEAIFGFMECLRDDKISDELYEPLRLVLTDPENDFKAEYAEMNIFDPQIERWSDIRVTFGKHIAKILPFKAPITPTTEPA